MNRKLSLGWNSWVELWTEKRRKRAAMGRGLRHMLNRKLSGGWNAWLEMVGDEGSSCSCCAKASAS